MVHVEDCSAAAEPKGFFLRIFPNPARSFFLVETADVPVWISLFSPAGQNQIENALQASRTTEISTKGFYILRWKRLLQVGHCFWS